MRFNIQKDANTIWLYHRKNIIRSVRLQYCKGWDKPIYSISNNGARKGIKQDTCFDFNIHFWRFVFSYTNWNYNHKYR